MLPKHSADFFRTHQFIVTTIPAFSPLPLQQVLSDFLQQDFAYRTQFAQKHYGYGFAGYSYPGQLNSTNQAYDDMLHTFVVSDFYPANRYPATLKQWILNEKPALIKQVKALEIALMEALALPHLSDFYQNKIGHTISCNYYPPVQQFQQTAQNQTRLSEHPDGSLFTVFPFGMDSDFEYQAPDGSWHSMEATDKVVIFAGYLLELWTNGQIKALNHKVKLPVEQQKERYSFAFFAIPRPNIQFSVPETGKVYSSDSYFEAYLGLFD